MSLTFIAAVRANKPKRNVNIISAGALFSVAIQKNGRAWGWGYNNGCIGDNTVTNRLTPVSVLGAVKTFCRISGGYTHSAAIDKNGRAWAWGSNIVGELGDNSLVSKLTPVSVLGAVKTFCKISAGLSYSLAIDKNGRAWSWGQNGFGQLGDNSSTQRLTPVSILGAVKTFCHISGANGTSYAIDKNGRAWGWGYNYYLNIGDNSGLTRLTPVSVIGAVKTFCQISGGYANIFGSFAIAIDKNGRAWGWGSNLTGQLGNNSSGNWVGTPVSVLGAVKTFCKISAGKEGFTLAIDKNGRAWGWGYNSFGQLGDGTVIQKTTPVSVKGAIKTFCEISAGTEHSIAVDKNGRAWAWGMNIRGQLGINYPSSRITPVSVLGAIKTFCQIAAGLGHALAIDKNGRVWGWGYGVAIGDNSSEDRFTPVSVAGAVKTFCKINAGAFASYAIDKNGRAWGWGVNTFGELGDNSTISKLTPVSVLGAVKTFCNIDGGQSFALAIDKNGRAWGWGRNGYGQLGDNSITSRLTPVSVLGAVKTFCHISAGNFFTLAIDKNGRAWSWGFNGTGQLGDTSIISKRTPVSVGGAVKTFCTISAGGTHSLVIDKNGRAWAWGSNQQGELGDNSITQRLTPVSILGAVKTFCKISAGNSFSLAIEKNGRAWGWGVNGEGQLGDNTNTSRRTPVSVAGAVKTFCEISAGRTGFCLAIDKNGRSWAWGTNRNGKLGTNQPMWQKTPVQVCNI